MKKQFKKTVFIFRRDLRLEDNTGLIFALTQSETVIPCFIFTPEQIEDNPYKSPQALAFMVQSLQELRENLRKLGSSLYIFYGKPEKIIEKCIQDLGIDAVVVNQDITPYSIQRDHLIELTCQSKAVSFFSFEDLFLLPIEQLKKKDRSFYTVFTPFYKNALLHTVSQPAITPQGPYYKRQISFATSNHFLDSLLLDQQALAVKGGRNSCLAILQQLTNRTFSPLIFLQQFTSHLSPHLKFTTCSCREIYWSLTNSPHAHLLPIRQLYWRDFFSMIALGFPHVFQGAFHPQFNQIQWNQNKKLFSLWCEGKTGFPIVDAGMRQLNTTGLMHNRARMICASFLVKDLHINWQLGEKYFATRLIDYDPAVNNGNWQWVASTGCDRQPYFRIFNPWLQQKKFDHECHYIRKWIPQLHSVSNADIHNWHSCYDQYPAVSYPPPCCDHKRESLQAVHAYQQIH